MRQSGEPKCPLPVNLERLIWNAQQKFGCKPHKKDPTGQSCSRARSRFHAHWQQWDMHSMVWMHAMALVAVSCKLALMVSQCPVLQDVDNTLSLDEAEHVLPPI